MTQPSPVPKRRTRGFGAMFFVGVMSLALLHAGTWTSDAGPLPPLPQSTSAKVSDQSQSAAAKPAKNRTSSQQSPTVQPQPSIRMEPTAPPATTAASQEATSGAQRENEPEQDVLSPDAIREGPDYLRAREEWFLEARRLPDGSVGARKRLEAIEYLDRMIIEQRRMGLIPAADAVPPVTNFPGPTTWTNLGPRPINVPSTGFPFNGGPQNSGRMGAIAVDPTNPNIVYVGGAAGGVWKTVDAGVNWTPLTDQQPSLSTGSIAVDPTTASCGASGPCNIIYVGTGEQHNSADSYYGAGVLKSIDGGNNWTQLGASTFAPGPGISDRRDGAFHIGAIAVDPFDSQIVLAGAARVSSSASSGIFRSINGGTDWTPVLPGAAGTSIVFDPNTSGIVYAALGQSGGDIDNGVYRSTDHGANWTKMTGSAANPFPTTTVGRIELGFSRSAPTTLLALIANSSTGAMRGLFKTTNANLAASADWIRQTSAPDFCSFTIDFIIFQITVSQCSYDLAIKMDPTDANFVFAGGSTEASSNLRALWRSTNGGATWTSVANGANGVGLHVDLQALAYSADGSKLYIGNDGGMWRTDDPRAVGTPSYTNLNGTLTVTMSYPGRAHHPSEENIMFVGTQDNGTQRYSGPLGWDLVTGGDGAQNDFDRKIPSTVYTACQQTCIFRSLTDGTTAGSFTVEEAGIASSSRTRFIPPLTADPNNAGIVYWANFQVYQSRNAASRWRAISPDLNPSSGAISALAVAPSDSNTVYAGIPTTTTVSSSQNASRIWKTNNALSANPTWTEITPSGASAFPPRSISGIAVDQNNANLLYATFSGFRVGADTMGHVFRSPDGGTTWEDISGTGLTALPNIPHLDIIADPEVPNALYVANDIGVFRTANANAGAGTIWSPFGTGLPRVVVNSLTLRRQSRSLAARTSGRGTWVIQLTDIPIPAGPFVSSIRPASVNSGSPNLTLTDVDGANFTGTSTVRFNGSAIATTFVSANKLTAIIPAASLTTPGVFNIDVIDGAATSDALRFAVKGVSQTIAVAPTSSQVNTPFTLTVNRVSGPDWVCSGPNGPTTITFVNGANGFLHNPDTCTASQITVNIPAAETTLTGNSPVFAFTPLPGVGESNTASVNVTPPPPPNDNFANAIVATAPPNFSNTQNTGGATTEAGEPVPPGACSVGQSATTRSIWYSFTPANNGTVNANTNGSNYNTIIQAVTGSLNSFAPVACGNTSAGSGGDSVSFAATAGTPYFFMVSSFNGLGGTTSVFNLSFATPVTFNPANVGFGNQTVNTTSATTTATLTNTGAAPLNVTSITKTGTDPTQFNLITSPTAPFTCPAGANALAVNASCTFGVNFAPTTVSAKSANIAVASDAAGSPHNLSLTGTGIAGTIRTFDNGGGDNQWTTPANWNPDGVPVAADTAVIPGAFNVTLASGAQTIATLTMTTTGTLTISGGSLTFTSSSTATNINISGGTFTPNANLTNSGSFTLNSGTLSGPGTLTIAGTFTWSGGTQDGGGITNANGGTQLTGTVQLRSRTVNMAGASFWTGPPAAQIDHGQGGVINNSGTVTVQVDMSTNFNQGGARGTINNSGLFTRAVSVGTATFDTTFNNTGTVNAGTGTLSFTSSYTQTAGLTRLGGGNNLGGGITFNFNGGVLDAIGGSTITGNVNNAGATVRPGMSPGTLNITGNYTQGAGGSLEIELGGTAAGNFDVLAITGTATLAGTLTAQSFGGFTPAVGNSFQVFNFASRTGDFTTNNLTVNGVTLAKTFNATNLTLTAQAAAADLLLTKSDSPDPVTVGNTLTYTLNLTNQGPDTANNVVVTDILPANVAFGTATGTGWVCVFSIPNSVTCTRASLAPGAAPAITITVTPQAQAAACATSTTITNTANATANEPDPNPANNSNIQQTTTVNAATRTFTNGAGDGLWTTAGNWNPSGVPAAGEIAVIPGALSVLLNTGAQTIATLTMTTTGTLTISGTGSLTFTCPSTATNITISGGTLTANAALTASGAFTLSSGTLNGSGLVTIGSPLTWSGGTMSGTGTTRVTGTGSISGGTLDGRTFESFGTFVGVSIDGTMFMVNNATLRASVNGRLLLNTNGNISPAGGSGTVTISLNGSLVGGSTGTFTIGSGIPVTNDGTITLTSGVLSILAGLTSNNSLRVETGALSTPTLTNNGLLLGTRTITGNVINNGTILPGVVAGGQSTLGTLTINGNYTQNSSGALTAQLGGTGAGQFDVLAVSGTATLAGTLTAASQAFVTFIPAPGNSFQVMNFASRTGDFTTNNLTVNGVTLTKTFNPTNLTLVAPSPTIDFVPAGPINFGNQPINTTGGATTVTVTNTGGATLNITNIALTGTDLTQFLLTNSGAGSCSPLPKAVAPGANCTFTSAFAPTTTGLKNANATLTDDAGGTAGTTQNIGLSGTGVAATVSFSPNPLNFGNQRINTTSAAQTETLTNGGTAPLNISAIGNPIGANATDFVKTGGTCAVGTPVPAAGNCTLIYTFTPGATGARGPATVAITDDATGSPHSFSLQGTGTAPVASFNTLNLAFGNQAVGTTSAVQTATLTNTGTDPLNIASIVKAGTNVADFSLGGTCAAGTPVPVAGSCTVTSAFTPSATGARAAATTVTDDSNGVAGSTQIINLSGTGIIPPTATLSTNTMAFGNQRVNTTSATQTVTVSNTSTTTPLTITSIVKAGANAADFSLGGTCPAAGGQVPALGSCTVTSAFTPAARGSRVATITLTDDAGNVAGSTQVISLSGTGIAPIASLSTNTLAFGNQRINTTSAAQTVTLTNTGDDTLNITSIVKAGANAADFSLGGTCPVGASVLAPLANCTITSAFTPSALLARAATITATDDSNAVAGSTQVVNLSGTGTAPVASLSSNTMAFGNQNVGTTSATQTVTLTNTGTDVLNITSVVKAGANAGDFSLSGTCPAAGGPIAPAASCTVISAFTPTATGARAATITFTDDSNAVAGSTQVINLTGTGTQPAVTLSAAAVPFGSVNVGDSKTASPAVTLTNSGTGPLTFTGITVTGTDASHFSQANTCPVSPNTLAAGANCTITPTFRPTATGARAASTQVADNATGSPHVIALSGTGVDFTVASTTPPQTVVAGTPANFTVDFGTIAGPAAGPVSFDCQNLPALAACTFGPAATLPAGTGNTQLQLAISTTPNSATASRGSGAPPLTPAAPVSPLIGRLALMLAMMLLGLLVQVMRKKQMRALFAPAMLLVIGVLLATYVTGCTSGFPDAQRGTPPGNYTVTVRGTQGPVRHTTTVQLTVQ